MWFPPLFLKHALKNPPLGADHFKCDLYCRMFLNYSQWICLESFRNNVIHVALPRLKGHGAIKLTAHNSSRQRFLPMLPQEQRHLLALLEYSPDKQVIEVERTGQQGAGDTGTQHNRMSAPSWHSLILETKNKWHLGKIAVKRVHQKGFSYKIKLMMSF